MQQEVSLNSDYKMHKSRYSEVVGSQEVVEPIKLSDKKIWRINDVAKFVGCTEGHIYNLVSSDRIPKIKKGKFLYFIPEVIHNWILEGDLQ